VRIVEELIEIWLNEVCDRVIRVVMSARMVASGIMIVSYEMSVLCYEFLIPSVQTKGIFITRLTLEDY